MDRLFLAELGLAVEMIGRDWEVERQLAVAYARSLETADDRAGISAVAGTLFRRAASSACLLGEYAEARALFGRAAALFHETGSAYSIALFALADGVNTDRDRVEDLLGPRANRPPAHTHQFAYALLALAGRRFVLARLAEQRKELRSNLEALGARPIGTLGQRVSDVLALADALSDPESLDFDRVIEASTPLLALYDSGLRLARHNRYHWARLAMPFHPADPDTLGWLAITERGLKRFQRGTRELLEHAAISKEARRLLVEISSGLRGAGAAHTSTEERYKV